MLSVFKDNKELKAVEMLNGLQLYIWSNHKVTSVKKKKNSQKEKFQILMANLF